MEDHNRLLNAFKCHPRHAQKICNDGRPPAEPVMIIKHICMPCTATDTATDNAPTPSNQTTMPDASQPPRGTAAAKLP